MSEVKHFVAPMRYITQSIVYIAHDLKTNADYLQRKRDAEEQPTLSSKLLGTVDKSFSCLGPLINPLPVQYCTSKSRLIILGHGNRESTEIARDTSGHSTLDPKTLAENVSNWLGNRKIERISLHMCYGGGNRGNAQGSTLNEEFLAQFEVRPEQSFAWEFAKHAGHLAKEISARTQAISERETRVADGTKDGKFVTAYREVGHKTTGYRYKGFGDKYVIYTDPSATIKDPLPPTDWYWPTEVELAEKRAAFLKTLEDALKI
jgi:hypothetical protein